MPLNITPGYDFDVHEVPTPETLLKQVYGMTISGIDVSALHASVVPVFSGDVSRVTNSIQTGSTVGTLWVSPKGDIFVQEQAGPVALHRVHGGWETRRIWVRPDSGFPSHIRPGTPVQIDTSYGPGEDLFRQESGHTRYSGAPSFRCSNTGSFDDNIDGWQFGILSDDTAVSAHLRVVGRGLTIFYDKDDTDSQTWSKLRDYQNGYRLARPSEQLTVKLMLKQYTHVDTGAFRWFGWTPLPGPGSSKVSQANGDHLWKGEHILYVFGNFLSGNQPN